MENLGVSSDVGEANEEPNSQANDIERNRNSLRKSLVRNNIYGWLAHSNPTTTERSPSKKMRPALTPKSSKSRSRESLSDIDSSNAKFVNTDDTREPGISGIRFLNSIASTRKSYDSMLEVAKINSQSSVGGGHTLVANIRGPQAMNAETTKQQRLSISIISNPLHDQNMHKPSKRNTNNENSKSSNPPFIQPTKKPKKRGGISLSSSLRQLITNITFNRNRASTSATSSDINDDSNSGINSNSNDAKASTNYNSKSTKNRDRKSFHNQVANKNKNSQFTTNNGKATATAPTTPMTTSSSILGTNNATNSILVTQQQQLNKPDSANPKRRYSQFKEPSSTASNDVNNALRRKTIGDSESLRGKVVVQDIPPCKLPGNADVAEIDGKAYIECPLCVLLIDESTTPQLEGCKHRVCLECMQRYITTEINHSRLNITCPICSEPIHPNAIKQILQNDKYYLKYESFMLRRVLAAEPDARWCPAPDCSYVVLASGCASCPKLVCGREGCNTSFCYHCKQEWHPNQTCSAAGIQRNKRLVNSYNIIEETSQQSTYRKSSKSSQKGTIRADDIKECPVCTSRIIKMNDGSCNHMTCSICETEFCWLCMKEISDLHYFSPSGCTFWGKKPWSRKKKILWQLGMLAGAPICILLIAGIAVPAIVIGIPVWAARKLHNRLERKRFNGFRKNAIITGGVLLSFLVSPLISAVALAIGIPFLLGYVYGVVPLSLCRSSGGCLSSTNSLEDLQREYHIAKNRSIMARDGISIDTATSHKFGDPSIGETSLYMSNASLETNSIGHVTTVERDDRESASNAGLAGSILSHAVDDGNSTRALAGSIISKESGYTLIPVEVHNSGQISNSTRPMMTASPEVAINQARSKSENKLMSC